MSENDSQTKVEISVDTLGNSQALDKAATSTQLDERRIATDIGRGIKPPYRPATLASFLELNETHAACVNKKARYEVGYGFDVIPHPEVEEPNETERETIRDFWFGTESEWKTGPEGTASATPEEVLELGRQDYHGIGWACWEILIDGDGRPKGLAHVPAWTVRVRKTETETQDGETVVTKGHGYVQVRDARTRYFGEAGDRYGDNPTFIDQETGEVADNAADLPNSPANELIFLPNHSQLSLYYGIPDWVPAMQTMGADQAAKEWNHDLFDNLGIPYYTINVTGGKLTETARKELKELQDNLLNSPYRTAVLDVEEFVEENEFEDSDGNNVNIEWEPIGASNSKDMEFQAFRQRNEHEITKVHGVPPLLIGVTETSNRANSREQVKAFAEEQIAPEQSKLESRLYTILHQTAFGISDWTVSFKLHGADQPETEARIAEKRIRAVDGAVTVNEAREAAGWGPVPDEAGIDGNTLLADLGAGGGPEAFSEDMDIESQLPPPDNKIGEISGEEAAEKLEPFEIEQFDSTNLRTGGYDYGTNELYVTFRRDEGTDSQYFYAEVPESEWDGLRNASSHGGYHYDNIRLSYPYLEITSNHERLPGQPSPGDVPDQRPVAQSLDE